MMKKTMRSTATAAAFAAALLVGACAHNTATTEPVITEVTQTEAVVPAPEAATVDSGGNVVAEPTVVSESTVTVTNAPLIEPGMDTTGTELTTTTTTTTTTVAAPTPAPMMSSSTVDDDDQTATTDDTTATTETETRTRLRKD